MRRNDDEAEVLQNRLKEYHAKTEPLAAFYEKTGMLHRIDGNRDRETVFEEISRLMRARHDSDQERQGSGKDAARLPRRQRCARARD